MKHLASLVVLLLAASPAFAAPVLKASVTVDSDVVTVADLFDEAGAAGETALFRSPAPGTSGFVAIADIREAAGRAGIGSFEGGDVVAVEVSRTGALLDETALTRLIEADLSGRGIIDAGVSAAITFNRFVDARQVGGTGAPARLVSLHYLPQSGSFAARFQVSGDSRPLDIEGRIELEVEVPHLAANLPAGSVIRPEDIEMRRVPLKFAESNGFARIEDLVGKALNRQTRAGMVLKPADVSEPKLVGRNELITIYFRTGGLTLTARGKALGDGGKGQVVPVLNTASNKIVQGVIVASGTVEIAAPATTLAGL